VVLGAVGTYVNVVVAIPFAGTASALDAGLGVPVPTVVNTRFATPAVTLELVHVTVTVTVSPTKHSAGHVTDVRSITAGRALTMMFAHFIAIGVSPTVICVHFSMRDPSRIYEILAREVYKHYWRLIMKTFYIDRSMKDNIVISMHEDGMMTWHTVLTRSEWADLADAVFSSSPKSKPMTDIERVEYNIAILNKRLLKVEKAMDGDHGNHDLIVGKTLPVYTCGDNVNYVVFRDEIYKLQRVVSYVPPFVRGG
jgi:hypothetical protein